MREALRRALRGRVARFRPKLAVTLRGYTRQQLFSDVGAGLTVGLVALPLATAFAIASGVKPEAGLITAIVGGFLVSALGGSRVQIGGPAGAFIVVVYGIAQQYGLSGLLVSTALSGLLLFFMGLFRLGQLVRFVPVSIIIGFSNGIAVLIILSQLKEALGLPIAKVPADFFHLVQVLAAHITQINPWALVVCAASLTLVALWPKLYTPGASASWRLWLARMPGTVVALLLASVCVPMFALPVETIGSRFGGVPQSLPTFALPEVSWSLVRQLFAPTLTLALLGAIESLLCARLADQAIDDKHDPNQELMAQGIANTCVPLFGGIPVTGTIARTMTNIKSGGRTPIAGMVHALTLLVIVLVAAPLASNIPLSALAGILLFVGWNMGEWREFARLKNFSLMYRTTLLSTFLLTVVLDLTVAVEVGLVLSSAFFIYRIATLTRLEAIEVSAPHLQAYRVFGSLFFGSVNRIEAITQDEHAAHAKALILDFTPLLSLDTTGIDSLDALRRHLERHGAVLIIAGATGQPLSLMRRSGFAERNGALNFSGDFAAALVRARQILAD